MKQLPPNKSSTQLLLYDQAIVCCVIGTLAIALIYANSSLIQQEFNVTLLSIYLSASLLIALGYRLLNNHVSIKINPMDIGVFTVLSYVILNLFFKNNGFSLSINIQGLLAGGSVYLLLRSVKNMDFVFRHILQGYLPIGLILMGYGYLQLLGVMPSNNPYFSVTGPFHNPAPFSCHLVLASIVSFAFWTKKIEPNNSQLIRRNNVYLIYFLANTVLMLSTHSRSAVMATIVGIGMLILKNQSIRIFRWQPSLKWLVISFIAGFMIIMTALYFIRPNSVKGRFLVWKISMMSFLDSPLLGVGTGNFTIAYNTKQIEYFSAKERSPSETMLADYVTHPFNEPILLLVEQGIAGILLIIGVAFLILRKRKKPSKSTKIYHFSEIVLTTLVIFGLTSYPSDFAGFTIIIFICLPQLATDYQHNTLLSFPSVCTKYIHFLVLLCCLIFFITRCNYCSQLARWNSANLASNGDLGASLAPQYHSLLSHLFENGVFLFDYGILLIRMGEHSKAIPILQRAQERFIKPELYLALGDSYCTLKEYGRAGTSYLKAAYLVPSRKLPRLRLAELYLLMGDTLQAKVAAQQILQMPTKISNATNQKIIADTEILLYRLK